MRVPRLLQATCPMTLGWLLALAALSGLLPGADNAAWALKRHCIPE